jgi:hypothetical protein
MIKLFLLIAISFNSFFSHQDIVPVSENTNGFNFKGAYFPINQTLITANTIIDNTPLSMPVVLSNVAAINTTAMSGVNDFRFAHEATDIVPGDIIPIPKYSLFGMLIV